MTPLFDDSEKPMVWLRFVTRMGMYIHPSDERNIVSFLTGYHVGSREKKFEQALEEFVLKKYRIEARATGWPGQFQRLSKKLKLSWEVTFKKVALEVLAAAKTPDVAAEWDRLMRLKIRSLVERITKDGDPTFHESWIEEWTSMCSINSEWFIQLWTTEELDVISSIDAAVQVGKVFSDKKTSKRHVAKLPTDELIGLRERFDILK